MPDLELLKRDLGCVQKVLRTNTQEDNICHDDASISWRKYAPGISHQLYPVIYNNTLAQKQFSLLLYDNSFFQFYFSWESGSLTKARLAFYAPPIEYNPEQKSIEEAIIARAEQTNDYRILELYQDLGRDINFHEGSYLRVDFDSRVTSHAKWHLQFGALEGFRIPVDPLVTPSKFVTFVLEHRNPQLLGEISNGAEFCAHRSFVATRAVRNREQYTTQCRMEFCYP